MNTKRMNLLTAALLGAMAAGPVLAQGNAGATVGISGNTNVDTQVVSGAKAQARRETGEAMVRGRAETGASSSAAAGGNGSGGYGKGGANVKGGLGTGVGVGGTGLGLGVGASVGVGVGVGAGTKQ